MVEISKWWAGQTALGYRDHETWERASHHNHPFCDKTVALKRFSVGL